VDIKRLVGIAQIVAALGTVTVTILAIWGDWFRVKWAAPKLSLKLRDTSGSLTTQANGIRVYYWHLLVSNKRSWALARRVQVRVTEIRKQDPDGEFHRVSLPIPVQLTWSYPQIHPIQPDIGTEDTCDLGRLRRGEDAFKLSSYITPNNFEGFVRANEAMQVTLDALADNHCSGPYKVEISWDGKWADNTEELSRHLIVKEVS
jgi:hypothetical protein